MSIPSMDPRFINSGLPPTLAANPMLDTWVRFEPDNTVTLFTGKVELGQGILSAVAQIAAEELDIAYERVRMQPVDTSFSPNEGSTTGSRSIQEGGEAMRQACAEIRQLFLQQAAQELEAHPSDLIIENGVIRIAGTDRQTSYWSLAPRVDMHHQATGKVSPKAPADFKLVGQSLPRKDLLAKLRGGSFLQDIRLPGMLPVWARCCCRWMMPPPVPCQVSSAWCVTAAFWA